MLALDFRVWEVVPMLCEIARFFLLFFCLCSSVRVWYCGTSTLDLFFFGLVFFCWVLLLLGGIESIVRLKFSSDESFPEVLEGLECVVSNIEVDFCIPVSDLVKSVSREGSSRIVLSDIIISDTDAIEVVVIYVVSNSFLFSSVVLLLLSLLLLFESRGLAIIKTDDVQY